MADPLQEVTEEYIDKSCGAVYRKELVYAEERERDAYYMEYPVNVILMARKVV